MVRSYPALTTLIRGRLNRDISDAQFFLHEKGIALLIDDENLYSLKTENDGHKSELFEVCYKGLIYRGTELVCFKGPRVPEMSLKEAQEKDTIVWNDKTVFAEKIKGKKMYMYWDYEKEDWQFADENKAINKSYGDILRNKLYNIMGIEYFFTYVFIISENNIKHETGIYLETMYDNKKGKEIKWDRVWNYAMRLKAKPVMYYNFEGFDKLEESDFPIYVLDISGNRILLTKM